MKLAKSFIAALLVILLSCTMCISAFAYNDVSADDESLAAIEFVDRLGIIQSTWGGDFNPDLYLTRADAVKAIYRCLCGTEINAEDYALVDVDFSGDVEADSALIPYLAWAIDTYLITDDLEESKFEPSSAITANEFLTLVAKMLRLVEDSDASYPDAYTDSLGEIAGEVEAGTAPVTRKQAAVVLTNAIMSSEGEVIEMGVYEDFDGNPLDSLAVKVFNMSNVDLVIRATKNRTLGYTVENGTLLSNGADVDFGEDLSEYVGYSINITYRDADSSKTYTEDEEILTYSVNATSSSTVSLSAVTITSGNNISIATGAASLTLSTSTYLYLNDDPWPIGDAMYDLVKLVPAIGVATTVANRPNLKFKCMQAGDDLILSTVFAMESRPGKIVGINNGNYTVYDYYYTGTKNEYRTYNVSQCNFTNTVKVGDYVNFYESAGEVYFEEGTVITATPTLKYYSETTGLNEYTLVGADTITASEHACFMHGDVPMVIKEDGKGPQYNFILDNSGENFLITWETIKKNYAQLLIKEITSDPGKQVHTIKATNLTTDKEVTFDVSFENTDSPVAIVAGDYVTYYDDGAEKNPVTYVKKNGYKLVESWAILEFDDYFEIVTASGASKYYKSQYYNSDLSSLTGEVKVNLDMANCVVSITQ